MAHALKMQEYFHGPHVLMYLCAGVNAIPITFTEYILTTQFLILFREWQDDD